MPKTIVRETSRSKRKEACAPPVRECNLSKKDVEHLSKLGSKLKVAVNWK